ncbi:hypothetical protein N7453_003552 [Penicillium expansum]|nr:hypothetical protein N7453_003552 [Penicillium expansum]
MRGIKASLLWLSAITVSQSIEGISNLVTRLLDHVNNFHFTLDTNPTGDYDSYVMTNGLNRTISVKGTSLSALSSGRVLRKSEILSGCLLIECDPSIKSMILKYDEERHDYIVEDLDDENHLVIKESQLQNLKVRLDQDLDEKIMQLDESESE